MEAGMMQAGQNVGGTNGFCRQYMSTGPMSARYIYTLIFLLGNVLAWVVRENPQAFFRWQRLSDCEDDQGCLTVEAVLIISLTLFLFFSIMFVSTVCTSSVHDWRNSWHSQWWVPKIIILAICLMISVLAPSSFIILYGKVAHLGAGIFLFIQLICVVRYITRLHSRWYQANNATNYLNVNSVSLLAYITFGIGIMYMSSLYTGCIINVVFIVATIMLVYLMFLISVWTRVRRFYMEPALMGVYTGFLCWSAIKSEPGKSCYTKKGKASSDEKWKIIISFIVELINIVVAAFSTGTDYKSLQFMNVVESENDVPYGYGYFHFVFATGSMYFGMLFISWDTHHASNKWSMDVSWPSTWIHIVNEGLAVIFFIAVVFARTHGTDWLRQFLGQMFGIGSQQHGDQQSNATETNPALVPARTEQQASTSRDDQSHATEAGIGRPQSLSPTTTTTTTRTTTLHVDDDDSARPSVFQSEIIEIVES